MPECLPQAASELLVDGFDSPALRTLAGIDLSPFDPPDEAADKLPQDEFVIKRLETAFGSFWSVVVIVNERSTCPHCLLAKTVF
jgi:hypothetical protein